MCDLRWRSDFYRQRPLAHSQFGRQCRLGASNGVVETRSFDDRYVPTGIQASGNRLTWNYSTDDVGNPVTIQQTQPVAESRTYGYQDFQYFLTSGAGPWPGPLSWTYDRIGNRLTETRGALTDTYAYVPNSAVPTPGRTAILDQITLGLGGTRDYNYHACMSSAMFRYADCRRGIFPPRYPLSPTPFGRD
jgi:hypothetical protein